MGHITCLRVCNVNGIVALLFLLKCWPQICHLGDILSYPRVVISSHSQSIKVMFMQILTPKRAVKSIAGPHIAII